MKVLSTLMGVTVMIVCGSAEASYVDDGTELGLAISQLRSAIGNHPRVLKIEIDPNVVTIEAQDLNNPQHVNRWRCLNRLWGFIPMRWVTGPEPVDLQLLDPDLEANLFDLDAVAFSETAKLGKAAIGRARIQDAAVVTHMEIMRQTIILPRPTAGDIHWALHITSSREHAEVFANAQGLIIGADLSATQRAKSLNLFKEPNMIVEATDAFRTALGTSANLTAVSIDARTVSFGTNMPDTGFGKTFGGMPAYCSFSWDLDGLVQNLGRLDVNALAGTQGKPAFSVGDVDWTIIAKLEASSLAKVAIAQAYVTRIVVEKSSVGRGLGGPTLTWTVEVTDSSGEVTSVVADTKGAIERVVLPESRRPKVVWLEPATIADAISRVSTMFGADARIVSIEVKERGGQVTVDDPTNGGQPTTFDLSTDGVTRGATMPLLGSRIPRLGVADLVSLTKQKITTLEGEALKKLGERKTVYLESVRIGADGWLAPAAGARAIAVRVRDVPEDSARAEYSWIIYDFDGRVLDFMMQ